MPEQQQNDRRGTMIGGAVLILLGVGFLFSQLELLPYEFYYSWWTYWPAILIVFGLYRLVRPRHAGDVGSGVTMILFGLWFFSNKFDWWGLTWRTSWPLALVAVGAGMVARAIASSVMPDSEEKKGKEETSHG